MNSKKEQKNKKGGKLFSPKYFLYDFVMVTGVLPITLYLRPKIYHVGDRKKLKELRGKGTMIMANHTGFIDPVLVHYALPGRRMWFLATQDLFDTKMRRWFFKRVNCIELNKEDMSINSYKDVVTYLSDGKVVGVFPEGQLSANANELQQFKLGITFMSIMNKVPIVPVYIDKRTSKWKRYKIVVGEPFRLYDLCSAIPTLPEIENAGKVLFEKEQELKDYFEKNIKNKKNKESI